MIEDGKVVSIDYQVVDENNILIDSADEQGPIVYLHGKGNIIAGLEIALEGKALNDDFEVTVLPLDGYGEINQSFIQQVSLDSFGQSGQVELGRSYIATSPNGKFAVKVTDIQSDNENTIVTVDANHPLAGKVLIFTGKVTAIRDATVTELERGEIDSWY